MLAAIVLVVSGFLGWWWIGMLVLVPWLAVAWFFRDPLGRRPDSPDPGDLVSPADGRISAIERVREHPAVDGPAVIIRIFLSVLDVHVNRSPCKATVRGRLASGWITSDVPQSRGWMEASFPSMIVRCVV